MSDAYLATWTVLAMVVGAMLALIAIVALEARRGSDDGGWEDGFESGPLPSDDGEWDFFEADLRDDKVRQREFDHLIE